MQVVAKTLAEGDCFNPRWGTSLASDLLTENERFRAPSTGPKQSAAILCESPKP